MKNLKNLIKNILKTKLSRRFVELEENIDKSNLNLTIENSQPTRVHKLNYNTENIYEKPERNFLSNINSILQNISNTTFENIKSIKNIRDLKTNNLNLFSNNQSSTRQDYQTSTRIFDNNTNSDIKNTDTRNIKTLLSTNKNNLLSHSENRKYEGSLTNNKDISNIFSSKYLKNYYSNSEFFKNESQEKSFDYNTSNRTDQSSETNISLNYSPVINLNSDNSQIDFSSELENHKNEIYFMLKDLLQREEKRSYV